MICIKEIESKQVLNNGFGLLETSTQYVVLAGKIVNYNPCLICGVDIVICILQNKWKIQLQLTKTVTWPPLAWGLVCGAAASGTPLCKL